MDKVTLERIETLHPKLREEAKSIITEINERIGPYVSVRFAQALRTWAEQDAIYAQGRTKPGDIVTFAKGGDSYHNYGLAVDIVLLIDKDKNGTFEEASWSFFGDLDKDGQVDFDEIDFVFKKYGWTGLYKANGKRWDFPHFQKTFGLSISQLKELHKKHSGYIPL